MVLTRSTARAQRRATLRRSSRLNDTGTLNGLESPRIRVKKASLSKKKSSEKSKERRDVRNNSEYYASASCATRSQRATQPQESELQQRREDIVKAEEDISAQWELLEQREEELLRMQLKREAQAALEQLEEQFQCPLCYEIMAHPYTLTPAECGHTFCALCTLKWFFSRLHRSCGSWHESVDCPVCRSLLILTPDATPRTIVTVPFTPNRLARDVIEGLLKKLEGGWGAPSADKGKCRTKSKSCRRFSGCMGKRVKSESRTPGLLKSDADGNSTLDLWTTEGELRRNWRERVNMGREEMDDIVRRWCHLSAHDFVTIRRRLGV